MRHDPTLDQTLLSRIASGDSEAVGDLYDRHASALLGLVYRIVGDRAEAEDILQDVFVRVWERAGSYDPSKGAPVTWLARVARNRAIDRLRSRASRPEFSECGCADSVASDASEARPFASAVMAEQQRAVGAALAMLTPEQRHLIEHAYYLGYSQSELAAHFRLPLGTVKTRIRAGMTTLRQHLQGTWAGSATLQ
ncbi:MAG: sigma-70 family RNA polymerase sigma factor [Vicinamibacterales bacterium]